MSNSAATFEPGSEVRIDDKKVVSFHYRLREVDLQGQHGEWLEQSFGRDPLKYLHGYHNVIVGLEKALQGKKVGDSINITLTPEQAYGPRYPNSIQRIPVKHLQAPPGVKKLLPGMKVTIHSRQGYKQVIVTKTGKFSAEVDFNHPLAGKILYYEIEVVGIRDATSDEITHGHVRGHGGYQH